MKKIFIKSPLHGDLFYKSIYDYFDGPKLFSVITNSGKLLLVYWTDESEDSYSWVALNITKHKLLELESKNTDIFQTLNDKELKTFYSIETFFSKKKSPIVSLELGKITDFIIMPDRGIYISQDDKVISRDEIENIYDSSSTYADYSVHINKPKKSKSPIDFRKISPVFDFLDEMNSAFVSLFGLKDKLLPGLGKPGSFILDFNSDKFNLLEDKLTDLCLLMKKRGSIESFLKKNKIPAQPLEKLLTHILNENLIVDLTNKNTEKNFLIIDRFDSEFYLKELQKITSMDLTSQQVPQADLLRKVFEMVENIWQDGFIDKYRLDLDDRHIRYYSDASKILGFVNETGSVTSIGQQLILASDDDKLSIASKCFENSRCGWAWVTWSDSESISQLNPDTAKEFLDSCALSLSETTKVRRARTLRSWCKTVQEHYKGWV